MSSAPSSSLSRPGRRPTRAGLPPGDEVAARSTGECPRDVIEWRLWSDEAEVELDVARGGLELDARGRTSGPASRSASRCRAPLFDQVRTCDNHCEFCFIYQLPPGMRRSLYLKDDDYRLSFLYGNFTTLTRFTEADLERVVTERPVAAARQHPRHRSRRCGPDAAQPARRHQPALAAGPARPRHRGARPDRGVPRRQRRRGARRHAGRHARPVPRAGVGRRRAARDLPVQPRGGDAPAHHGRGRRGRRRRRGLAGRVPAPCSAGGWCSPPTSTTCWPGGRSRPPSATRASPCTRTASAWPARSSSSSRRRSPTPPASGAGFFAAADGRRPTPAARPRCRRNPAAYTGLRAATRRRRAVTAAAAPAAAPIGILTGELGARVLAPARSTTLGRDDVRVIPVDNEFFGGNTGVTGLMVGADLTRVLAAEPTATATCCPTCACPTTAASSTAPPSPTCPARSRSSPPTASPCAGPLE